MWQWAAVIDLIMVRLHGLTLETSLCIQLTYAWLTFCRNEAGRLTVSVHQHRRSANVQDFDWAVKQTDSGKTSKTNPGFQPLTSKWRGSGHPFLSFIWPAVSSWDDQHFKLTRNGKRAPSQHYATVGRVYIIVLKTLIEEALPSVIEYLIGHLQLDKNNRQTEVTVSPWMLYLSWHPYKTAVMELVCLNRRGGGGLC